MTPHKKKSLIHWLIGGVIIAAIVLLFGIIYFDDHAWGTWGDDSAGYIYLAGRMIQDKPLVYHDDLAQMGFDFFGDEKLARWLTPTHHEFINQEGWIASKYPVGASLLLALVYFCCYRIKHGGRLLGACAQYWCATLHRIKILRSRRHLFQV